MNAWLSHVQLACAPHDARPYAPTGLAAECLSCPCAGDDAELHVLIGGLRRRGGTWLMVPMLEPDRKEP